MFKTVWGNNGFSSVAPCGTYLLADPLASGSVRLLLCD